MLRSHDAGSLRAADAGKTVTLAGWAGALQVPLHFDDYDNLLNDEATRDLGALRQRLHRGVRPLLRVSFFVDHALGQLRGHVGEGRHGLAHVRARGQEDLAVHVALTLQARQERVHGGGVERG